MKKTLSTLFLTISLSVSALSPNEMLAIVGAVKFYNENCAGLNPAGARRMNQGLKRFKMDKTPISVLEQHPFAISTYNTAKKYGCDGTKREAQKAGFFQYIN
ncbi:hypothetical protein [Bathymodiolus septemdierum thioautotrophic gill symbiont]|uniref:Uncharacterized protein n=1 Tax=endosymbiont of Bathymodiolus septemdierum str. Myojin knoll TaxID=1303921 RepID=A0A0P0URN9_9GAMM|nr:hypothetical protein [Bathymodiolus septemdierum thioautotrophic gill symbiont]BAS67793.1 conserved hypothetical protein [endosymbiont of Bathymodiolus septemdierum str. Myojin knoll]